MYLIILVLALVHPIHISVCEMNYSTDETTFQFSQRIFADDLEIALNKENGTSFDILKLTDNERDVYLKKYIANKILVTTNNLNLDLKYLGSEIEEGVCWIYFESPPIPKNVKTLNVKNSVLFELYKDQSTIIQVVLPGKDIKAYRLYGDKIEEVIPLN